MSDVVFLIHFSKIVTHSHEWKSLYFYTLGVIDEGTCFVSHAFGKGSKVYTPTARGFWKRVHKPHDFKWTAVLCFHGRTFTVQPHISWSNGTCSSHCDWQVYLCFICNIPHTCLHLFLITKVLHFDGHFMQGNGKLITLLYYPILIYGSILIVEVLNGFGAHSFF